MASVLVSAGDDSYRLYVKVKRSVCSSDFDILKHLKTGLEALRHWFAAQ